MAELSEKWWKKNKAKTLRNEPLTAALKSYDRANSKRQRDGYAEDVKATLDALELVSKAIEATKKKCNSKLHKQTLGHLDDLKKLAKVTKKQLDDHVKNVKTWFANFGPLVKSWLTAWTNVPKAPSSTTLNAYAAAAAKARDHLKLQDKPYPWVGEYFGNPGGTLFRYAELHEGEARKLATFADQADAGDNRAETQLKAALKEFSANVKMIPQYFKQMAKDAKLC